MNPILIAAAKFEFEPLANALQHKGQTPEVRTTGIGALNAAKKSRTLGDSCRGRDVIFVGTCGAFTGFNKVTLIRARDVVWLPTGERVKLSYPVKDSAPPISLPEPPEWSRVLPEKRVICGPSISLIGTLPEGFNADAAVENLELYSCIGEIAAAAKSLAVILAITNLVSADSHAQWRQNFALAAGMTAEFIANRLT